MPLKILVVDDSPLILKMLKSALQKKGHVVTCTTNGYEALDLIRKGWREEAEKKEKETYENVKENRDKGVESVGGDTTSRQKEKGSYDAVLLDIQMPIIDGLQVMQEYSKMLLEYNVEQGEAKANEIVEGKTDETKEMERDSSQEGISSLHDYHQSLRSPSAATSSPPPLAMVAMSANSDPKTMEAATAVGADYFFGKPFDIDAFLKVARRALSKKTETIH
jgi:CheY-like chemotaxis protein